MPDQPGILYHYCDDISLMGILAKKEIWLSDPRFMNDSREAKHAGNIFARTFLEIAEDFRQQYIERGLPEQTFHDWISTISQKVERGALSLEHEGLTPFIFCLSRDWNSLSQWRAYGNGQYCVGFDRVRLEQRTRGRLHEIAYKEAKRDPELAWMIQAFFESHRGHVSGGQLDTEVRFGGDQEFQRLKQSGYDYFLRTKHVGFREEQEWRLVLHLPPNDSRVFFHTSGRYPTPRVRFEIFSTPEEAHEVIKEVVCGPGADRERATVSFVMIRKSLGIDLTPKFSEIPYRTTN